MHPSWIVHEAFDITMSADGRRKRKRDFAALSLNRFAGARQSLAQKQKEKSRKANARKVNEYRKVVRRLEKEGKLPKEESTQQQEHDEGDELGEEAKGTEGEVISVNEEGTEKGKELKVGKVRSKIRKKDDDIDRVDRKNEAKRQAQRKLKEEAQQRKLKEQEEAEKAARLRKKERSKFRRTNSRGQPLMKFQIEKIVERLENERKKKSS